MQVFTSVSLKPYNTFGIDARANFFTCFNSAENLKELLREKIYRDEKKLLLGGGSNILLAGDFKGIVLKNEVKGIDIISEDKEHIYLKVGAGENWHRFVMHCVKNGYAGVENLSLIPGNAGASPMQNIGAYGVELKDVFYELEAVAVDDQSTRVFRAKDCAFGYRDSIFKNELRDRYIIMHVTFRLNKIPKFNTSYGALHHELEQMGIKDLSISAISRAVINIRSSKLPDPQLTGNAGSFFKNPEVPLHIFHDLSSLWSAMPSFPSGENLVKLPAGWLIEQCGWKGFRRGDAGCYEKQALVLVNYGNARGEEILDLANEIIDSVYKKFKILLEKEVNVI